jgi:hypothetical protein
MLDDYQAGAILPQLEKTTSTTPPQKAPPSTQGGLATAS